MPSFETGQLGNKIAIGWASIKLRGMTTMVHHMTASTFTSGVWTEVVGLGRNLGFMKMIGRIWIQHIYMSIRSMYSN